MSSDWAAASSSNGSGVFRAGLCTHSRAGFALPSMTARPGGFAGDGGSVSLAAALGAASSGGGHALPLCAAGPRPAPPLAQAACLTKNQLLKGGRKPKPKRRDAVKALKGSPQRKGICLRVYTVPPKKPNSANRAIAKIALSTGTKVVTYIPGEGHNLQVRCETQPRAHRTAGHPRVATRAAHPVRYTSSAPRPPPPRHARGPRPAALPPGCPPLSPLPTQPQPTPRSIPW
jgi:small subunit ribosomal protein S12